MPMPEDIKVITVDGNAYAVADMSKEVQQLVVVYNEWNHDLAVKQREFHQLSAAVQVAKQSIIEQIRREKEEKTQRMAAENKKAAENNVADSDAANDVPQVAE